MFSGRAKPFRMIGEPDKWIYAVHVCDHMIYTISESRRNWSNLPSDIHNLVSHSDRMAAVYTLELRLSILELFAGQSPDIISVPLSVLWPVKWK